MCFIIFYLRHKRRVLLCFLFQNQIFVDNYLKVKGVLNNLFAKNEEPIENTQLPANY